MIKFGGLLRQRDFRLLWCGQFISGLGDWILIGALPFHVYALTDSAIIAGTMFMAQVIPSLVLGPVVGVFVDRLNRRWTMFFADLGRGLVILALLGLRSPESVWLVYVVAALESSLSRVAITARMAFMPSVVSKDDLAAANSLWMISANTQRILGPWLGALLLTVTGLGGVVLTDALSYFVSGAMVLMIGAESARDTRQAAARGAQAVRGRAGVGADWVDGLRFIRSDRVILGVFATTMLAWTADGAVTALFVVFVSDIMRAGVESFGWLMSARGAGGFIGGVAVAWLTGFVSPTRLLPLGLTLAGAFLALMVTFPSLPLALCLTVLTGIAVPAWLVGERTILHRTVRGGYRGRVFGWFDTIGGGAVLIGMGIGSVSAEAFGARPVLLAASVMFVSAGAAALAWLPRELPVPPEVGAVPESPRQTPAASSPSPAAAQPRDAPASVLPGA